MRSTFAFRSLSDRNAHIRGNGRGCRKLHMPRLLAMAVCIACASVGGILGLGNALPTPAGASVGVTGPVAAVGAPAPARASSGTGGIGITGTRSARSDIWPGVGILPPGNPPGNIAPNPNLFSSGTCNLVNGILSGCQNACFDGATATLLPILVQCPWPRESPHFWP